ncbi:hypothetical protein D9M68_948400 [compost metagenome]
MTHHLKVIAPKNLVAPSFHFLTVDFLQLRWVVLRRGERALAAPVEHGVALDRFELVLLDVGGAAFGRGQLQAVLRGRGCAHLSFFLNFQFLLSQ